MELSEVSKQVLRKAIELFKAGVAQDNLVQKKGKVEKPIPIYDEQKNIVSWFVGLTVTNKLVGFIQLNSNLELMRYSTFQRRPKSLEGCPESKTWLDPKYIKERARCKASPGDILKKPFLSFDQNITRIVWVVNAVDKTGNVKKIFAAGDFVYLSNSR
jgi:hypothetical protein